MSNIICLCAHHSTYTTTALGHSTTYWQERPFSWDILGSQRRVNEYSALHGYNSVSTDMATDVLEETTASIFKT